ncbi:MAG: class I SAM-dependent methyltransferase [Desulfobacterales bacterium]|nr:class I SAM-dependent methyltransferase [Desulfobacterales bacterium]
MSGCLLCGGRQFRPVICEGKWQYVRCSHCGLVFLSPQPAAAFLHEHYQDYLPADPEAVEAWRRLAAQVFAKSALLIQRSSRAPGRLLDVGCGYGFFLEQMARCGWKVEGVEISATGRGYAGNVLGLKVSSRPLPRPDWPDACYDAITLFYVIEHLPDPVAVLREAFRLLRPGGVLLLRWPHTTPIVTILKPWAQQLKLYQAPSHLFDFCPQTIYNMLDQLGFRQIRTTVCGWTRPAAKGARLAALIFGGLGEKLASISRDRLLLPGVSKTTVALR